MLYGEKVLTESNVFLHLARIKSTEVHESSRNHDNGIGSAGNWWASVPPGISFSFNLSLIHIHAIQMRPIRIHNLYIYIYIYNDESTLVKT